MSFNFDSCLDLDLAWKRIKLDVPHRVFIRNPLEIKIIERDKDSYFDNITDKLKKGKYYPGSLFLCNVPKGKGLLRPGAHICIDDRLIYYACIGSCLPYIYETVRWAQGNLDFSYQISNNFENPQWLTNQFHGWNNFRIRSLKKIEEGAQIILMTDISGYYDNIDIKSLMSDLRSIKVHEEVINLISMCLNRWAQVEGRGIPQGYTPSDLLGKLYLNSIDQNLRDMGFNHFRYVDDFRIFCRNEPEAKRALIALNGLLRRRGLQLQSAKTGIYSANVAKDKIDGIHPILQPIIKQFMENIIDTFESQDPYLTVAKADKLLGSIKNETPITVLREAFDNNFSASADEHFDKTLFRFLINRLGSSRDAHAQNYCLAALKSHPEETSVILNYFRMIDAIKTIELSIIKYMASQDAVYSYQTYQILEWFSDYCKELSGELLSFSRRIAFDRSEPKYLRSVSRRLIAKHGTTADLERLEHIYSEIDDEFEKCEIIYFLKRMERSKRNTILSRASHDGELIRRSVELVRDETI